MEINNIKREVYSIILSPQKLNIKFIVYPYFHFPNIYKYTNIIL